MTGMTEFWYAVATWFALTGFVAFLVAMLMLVGPRDGREPPEPMPRNPAPDPEPVWTKADDEWMWKIAGHHPEDREVTGE